MKSAKLPIVAMVLHVFAGASGCSTSAPQPGLEIELCEDVECVQDAGLDVDEDLADVGVDGGDTESDVSEEQDGDSGSDVHEGADRRTVVCKDAAPLNGTSEFADVEITRDGEVWSEPEVCRWTCNRGYVRDGDLCINTRRVSCTDVAPSNATSTVIDVEIEWQGDQWSEPEACSWRCNDGHGLFEGACVSSRTVLCADVAPLNGTSTVVDVELQWDGESFGQVPACAWSCDEGYVRDEQRCIDRRMVPCVDVAPMNATSIVVDVEVQWDGASWGEPAVCAWRCDAGYGQVEQACLDTLQVPCRNVAPSRATSIIEDVEVTWTGSGWSEPRSCEWVCQAGTHRNLDRCIDNVTIDWCRSEWPSLVETRVGTDGERRGRVHSSDGTARTGQLEGVTSMVCHSYGSEDVPIDLGRAICTEGRYLRDANGPAGPLSDDEYQGWDNYATIGFAHYFWAFSGDGGESWTFCDQDGVVFDSLIPGRATVFGAYNGDFTHWRADGTLPLGWTKGSGIGLAREVNLAQRGGSAVRLTRQATNNALTEFSSVLQPVIGGQTYRIDFYVLDNDPGARGMINYQWYGVDGAPLPGGAIFTNQYSVNDANWQVLMASVVAPVEARYMRVAIRVYGQPAELIGGSILVDDALIVPLPSAAQIND
jgi:hypothetical protein